MDVISLLQRLSSHKAAGTSSAQHVPAVDDTHNVDDEELPFEERERRRQFGGARRPAPPPSQPLASPPPSKPVAETKQQQLVQLPKRANKNRPVEQSSKKAVPRFRDVLQAGNKGPADPRFARDAEEPADRSSTKELWRKRYAFVFDELLPKEKEEAQRAMSKVKSVHTKAALQEELRAVQGQMQAERDRRKRDEREDKLREARRAARAEGKTPYYLKKSEKRKLELVERYKELEAAGKVDQYLQKRRKRNAAKEHKLVPSARRSMY